MAEIKMPPRKDDLRHAIFAIIFAVLALSLGDAVIKSFSVSFPLWQLYVLRSAIALPILLIIIKMQQASQNLEAIGWVALRSLLLVVMWVAYYAALPHLQLSVAAAAFYTLPLFITLFSGVFTAERVGKIGWTAIGLGFVGVLVILRPDAEGFNMFALLPVFAAILYALAMILTRTKCQNENPLILAAALNLAFIVVGGVASIVLLILDLDAALTAQNIFLMGGWVGLGIREVVALVVLAVAILIGSVFTATAYQMAPSSIVSTFDYTYLVFAVLWGVVFFAEFPDGLTLFGIVMIAVSGIIAVRR